MRDSRLLINEAAARRRDELLAQRVDFIANRQMAIESASRKAGAWRRLVVWSLWPYEFWADVNREQAAMGNR